MESDSAAKDRMSMPAAEPVDLAALVDYGDGAVISRTIVKNKAGTVTLFSFDVGEGLSEHTAPFDALVTILDGRASIVIGGKTVEASAGRSVLMPAGVPHSLSAVEKFKMLLVMIRG